MITPSTMQREGGKWLGAVRTRIQTMFTNGNVVIFGSSEILLPRARVKDVEELAAYAACIERRKLICILSDAQEIALDPMCKNRLTKLTDFITKKLKENDFENHPA